jgi:uncharacterized membrane-anchored protein YhcB (DUF1043 family)
MLAVLWGRFSSWIIGALALLAAVAGVYLRGRSAGKQFEQQKELKEDLAEERARAETIQEVSDVQTEVARLPAGDVHERLRDKWTRD